MSTNDMNTNTQTPDQSTKMSQHIIEDDVHTMLLEYACGTLNDAHALLMASYVSLRPDAHKILCKFEDLGGDLLDSMCKPEPLSSDCFEKVLLQLNGADEGKDEQEHSASNAALNSLPQPLRAYITCNRKNTISWKPFMKGIKFHILKTADSNYNVMLLNVPPGVKTPAHRHEGSEITLILQGAFHDKTGSYNAGDLVIHDEHVHHQPIGDEKEGCICLVVTDAPVKFTGRWMRLLNILQQ